MTYDEEARKEVLNALSQLEPVSPHEADTIAQQWHERLGIPKEEILRRLHIRRHRIEPPPVPFKPPWDYRDGVVYAAFPGVREELIEGKHQAGEPGILIMSSEGKVLTLQEAVEGGIEPDENWHDQYVDWRHESAQPLMNGEARVVDIWALFRQIEENIQFFVDLPAVAGFPPEEVAELLSLWALGTYFTPVWSTYGCLHFDAAIDECGKSRAGDVVSRMSFWRVVLAAGSSPPEWRDSAHFGRTQFLDDPPNLSDLGSEALAMLHVGYRRGAQVRLKRLTVKQGWVGAAVDVFAPRVIAAVTRMKPMLRGRTFRIVMERTTNEEITKRDPTFDKWPHDPAQVRDGAYSYAFTNMCRVEEVYKSEQVRRLAGRIHEIGRPLLTLAFITEDAGQSGLFERTVSLLEAMGQESLRDRGQAGSYQDLVRAAWSCYKAGDFLPLARNVAAHMVTPLGKPHPAVVGRQLSGVSWVRSIHPAGGGQIRYFLDGTKLREEMERLGLGDE